MVRSEHLNLALRRALQQAERKELPKHPEIASAVVGQILRGHPSYQQRHNAPLPIADRLYRALRWTRQGGLPRSLASLDDLGAHCRPAVLADVRARWSQYAMQLHDLDAFLKLDSHGPASKRVREVREAAKRIEFGTKGRKGLCPLRSTFEIGTR